MNKQHQDQIAAARRAVTECEQHMREFSDNPRVAELTQEIAATRRLLQEGEGKQPPTEAQKQRERMQLAHRELSDIQRARQEMERPYAMRLSAARDEFRGAVKAAYAVESNEAIATIERGIRQVLAQAIELDARRRAYVPGAAPVMDRRLAAIVETLIQACICTEADIDGAGAPSMGLWIGRNRSALSKPLAAAG